MRFIREERGFTLIELMVVILIIGILVAIAVPVFNAARENAQIRTCQANLRTIAGAIETYRASNGESADATFDLDLDDLESKLVPNYLKSLPRTCPLDGDAYDFSDDSTETNPTVVCPHGHTY